MKDRVFTGRDVAEALAAAGRDLGLAPEALRYVVLDPGAPKGPGLQSTPARIAVLIDGKAPARAVPAPEAPPSEDAAEGLRRTVRTIVEAADLDLQVELVPAEGALIVRLSGPDRDFFFEEDGEVFRATEHLLQRMFGRLLPDTRIGLECEGYREWRDEALRQEARVLAAAVRASGEPRSARPMNAYERRIVHLALSGEPGVETRSVGEGEDRRVTVAPRSREDD